MKTDIIQKTILLNPDGKILLLRRSDTDNRRPLQWDFPGGVLDDGETLEQGTLREITEETGVVAKHPRVVFAKAEVSRWSNEGQEHVTNVVRIYYTAKCDTNVVVLSYEHSEFTWVSLDVALEMLEYPRHKEVIQYILDNKLEL